jgi:hypothetical protein
MLRDDVSYEPAEDTSTCGLNAFGGMPRTTDPVIESQVCCSRVQLEDKEPGRP